ncbi:hypothetical protein POX_b02025 [Penicillium oxalicum]|uniref:hypothetical protein n=1 Tax=Penicillium oxalicum TaxID=69781 RepID=UPI0020B6EE05|nr:hypothetical protein POX_b02025 [Penicillium oxalicum]KAI2791994.1 hypothetical protein POX_b02025 [Penicillium oxalicum]
MASQDEVQRQRIMQALRQQVQERRQMARIQAEAQARAQVQVRVQAQAQAQSASSGGNQSHPRSRKMGSHFDDLPIMEAIDVELLNPEPTCTSSFDFACREGPLSTVEDCVTSKLRTPAFLHRGLLIAIRAGHVEAVQFLLSHGAPIARHTPELVLRASPRRQIEIFELFLKHGWTPNNPGFYGAVILPRVIDNIPLLSWFLAHGADPNLGPQKDFRDRLGASDTESCVALETASARGSLEAVQMLLDAGARIQNGTPLHCAAGACPPGVNPHAGRVIPSKGFDADRIPIMSLLVEKGADVNEKTQSQHMVPQYAIVHAVMAGAMERVKWLIAHGADPYLKGAFGSAVNYASFWGAEMTQVIEEALSLKKTSLTIAS